MHPHAQSTSGKGGAGGFLCAITGNPFGEFALRSTAGSV